MDLSTVAKAFMRMGAKINVNETFATDRIDFLRGIYKLDVARESVAQILDVDAKDRHLLLLVKDSVGVKSKFLCGHDERDWFIAAVPENRRALTVDQAKEALKPSEVLRAERRAGVKGRRRHERHNAARVRQGEWFFIPAPNLKLKKLDPILKNEPMVRSTTRGRMGKPHFAEEAFRTGGTSVWVSQKYPQGIREKTYLVIKDAPANRGMNWSIMVRDAEVYVRGRITHPDHATIVLRGWHRVLMNTENKAASMGQVAFLD